MHCFSRASFFFFNDTATTEIYTLSLHDALPISAGAPPASCRSAQRRSPASSTTIPRDGPDERAPGGRGPQEALPDRKSTRLNSSHGYISYAVFCLKKKKPLTEKRLARDRLPRKS